MKNAFGSLGDDDVRQIALLVEALDRSSFDFLQLDVGDFKLTLGKGAPLIAQSAAAIPPPAEPPAQRSPAPPPPTPAAAPAPPAAAPAAAPRPKAAPADGTTEITAPLMGLFYSRPDPGSPPFVTVGATVSEGSTVGLLEVMKVFNAIPAGVNGVITEICVQDAEMVQVGQTLFRIRPSGAAA